MTELTPELIADITIPQDLQISPDGKYLAYADKTGTYLRLMSTGEAHSLLPSKVVVQYLSWFPDSARLLLAHWPAAAHNHSERMEQSVVPRLGRGRQRLFHF